MRFRVGNGPVFNPGERVEAFTGPLWVAILSVADLAAPFRLEWIAVVLGLALSLVALWLAMSGARRIAMLTVDDAFAVPFGVLVLVAILPMWIFATSGLETGLTFAWLGASLWILSRWAASPERLLPLPQAFALGLGWLVRPELVLFSLAFLALVLTMQWRHTRMRARIELVVAAFGTAAVSGSSMAYFGSLVANTTIAKEGTTTNWESGWDYLRDFADPYWLWVPAVIMLLGGYVPLLLALGGTRARSGARHRRDLRGRWSARRPLCRCGRWRLPPRALVPAVTVRGVRSDRDCPGDTP